MKKRMLLAAAAALAFAGASVPIAAALAASPYASQAAQANAGAPAPKNLTGTERAQALAAASAAVNKIKSAQGRFTQIAPSGARTTGAIYLQRPGKLRFAYDAPSPLTIVSNGATVSVEDREARDVSTIPLRSTPLFYVLKRDVSFDRDARIVRVVRRGGDTLITARDRTGEADGEITITFDPNYQLAEWTITDGQRQKTRVILSDVRPVAKLDPRLFQLDKSADVTARRP